MLVNDILKALRTAVYYNVYCRNTQNILICIIDKFGKVVYIVAMQFTTLNMHAYSYCSTVVHTTEYIEQK